MRKIFLLVLVAAMAVCGAPNAWSQVNTEDEPRNEFALGYGAVNSTNALDGFSNVIGSMFGARYKNGKFIGPFSAEYFYHISPLFGVGGIGVFNHHSHDVLQNDQVTGKRTSNYFTIMPAVKFNWLRKDKWGMYSKAGVGYTRAEYKTTGIDAEGDKVKDRSSDNFVNFQVSLVGIEAGNRSVRGFAELGFGEQGLIHGGVRFRF